MGALYPEAYLNVKGDGDGYNFSFNEIEEEILIPEHQQMVVVGELQLENTLLIDGELTLIY